MSAPRKAVLALSFLAFASVLVGQSKVAKPPAPADLNDPPADAQRLTDGLVMRQLSAPTGTQTPAAGDLLRLRYSIWKSDGSVLEFIPQERVAIMAFDRMMPGWKEAVSTMAIGERRRAWIPDSLGAKKIPDGQTLVIDTELVGIMAGPKTPADLTAPPADALKSKSGLAWVVLREPTGTKQPKRSSTVRVNYSGWTTDGRLFDSTLLRDQPAQFRLDGVIAGWTEGMQQMKEGEIRRFWIPAKLAYADDPSKPQGMLIFDVELLEVK